MKSFRNSGPAVTLVAVLALLVVTSPRQSDHAKQAELSQGGTTPTPGASSSSTTPLPGASAAPTAGTVAHPVVTAGPRSSTGPGQTVTLPPPGSGLGGGGGGATYQGVLDKTIKMGFTWQHQACGNYTDSAVAAGFGVPQPDPEASITAAIAYFERFPTKAFPDLAPAYAKGVSAKTGYWGRRVKPLFADNGGPLCADKARATATQLAVQDKVLGTVQIPNDGTNPFIAEVMAAHHTIDIGAAGLLRDDYKKWSPYVYDVTFSGTDAVEAWSSYSCRDLVGKTSTATGDIKTAGKKRVFAVVHQDTPLGNKLAAQTKKAMSACGGTFTVDVAYPTDLSQQGPAATNAIAQMVQRGVTTVYMLTDPLFTATLTGASTGASYMPEWSVSSVGFNDVAFVVEHFYDKGQQANVSGASYLSSSTATRWDQSPVYKAWKMVNPNTEPPGDWNNWYLQIEVLYAGLLGAGPTLTPTTFNRGLQDVCGPCYRVNKKDTGVGFGPGDTTGVDDFTIVKFNTTKQNTHDPGDGTGRPAYGDWDFPEGGRRYYRTVAHPV